ncbi:MAG: hypothetical protein R6U44_10580 [Archaeoglobaceae archaeon]
MMEKMFYVNHDNIIGIESIIFLSVFMITFLFVAEFVPAFFAFLITVHELKPQIPQILKQLNLKGYNNYGKLLNLWTK